MATRQANPRTENLVRLSPMLGSDAIEMQHLARCINRVSERQCNGYADWRGNWHQAAADRDERRGKRLVARATALAAEHGLLVYVQSDPRGWPLYLYSQADLDAYNERCKSTYGIDSVYSSMATGVCDQ